MRCANRIAILAAWCCLATSRAVAGPPADLPLKVLVAQSDLIIIGQVTDKKGPEKRLVKLPRSEAPVELQSSQFQTTIDKILLDRQQAVRDNQVMFLAYDVPPAPDLQVAQLKKNVKYLLILERLPDVKGQYYLPAYYKHYLPATDDHVQAVQTAIANQAGR